MKFLRKGVVTRVLIVLDGLDDLGAADVAVVATVLLPIRRDALQRDVVVDVPIGCDRELIEVGRDTVVRSITLGLPLTDLTAGEARLVRARRILRDRQELLDQGRGLGENAPCDNPFAATFKPMIRWWFGFVKTTALRSLDSVR